jgi:NDP-sugar pyrophosphorylase family protein
MQVMILAAGRSTRLGSLGLALPKPLLPVCGYPAVTYALALCREAGLHDVVINLHHHADKIGRTLGDGSRFGVKLRYSVEEELLGTGGGVSKARALFSSEPVLIINGKVAADVDLRAVIAAHTQAPRGTVATMVLREDPHPELWAPVGIDAEGRVKSLRGQRVDSARTLLAPRMFTGIHVVESALLDRLPAGVCDMIGDAYIPALRAGDRISSMTMTGYFAEHSTPESYLAGNLALVANPSLLSHPPGPLAGVDPAAQIDSSARIVDPVRIAAGAVVEAGAVVGPWAVVCGGARVSAGTQVVRSVVWPGATAQGNLLGAIVAPEGPLIGETTPPPVMV